MTHRWRPFLPLPEWRSLVSLHASLNTVLCHTLTESFKQVYASYRHLGVGAAAIQEMERRAKCLGATHTTFNTMAMDRHLRVFKEVLGYHEYKARNATYSVSDIVGAGWPSNYQVAAFLEKQL